jgi:hypothetical protein
MSDFVLRPQEFRFVESVRGCNPPTTTLTPVDPTVWHGMEFQDTACLKGQTFEDACFYSWSWDITKCTDMMPFNVGGWRAFGVFTQISSLAASLGVEVGSHYMLHFSACSAASCQYVLSIYTDGMLVHKQSGDYNYTRSSRYDPNDGMGGANIQSTIEFGPTESTAARLHKDWGSLWIARERFSGSWQSCLGFATFELDQ